MRDNNNNKDDNGGIGVKKTKKSKRKKKNTKKELGDSKKDGNKVDTSGRKLTLKQEAFCREFLLSGSLTESYIKAYDKTSKTKRNTIYVNSYALSKKPAVMARIAEMRQKLDDKWTASKEKTIKRLMQCQEFDIRSLYAKDGKLLQPHELSEDAARGIAGVRYDSKGNLVEYKLLDIKGCAELLGRHLRLFADKVEVDVNVTHKMSDDELAQRIMRIEQSVQRIAAGGDVPRIASQPEPIDAEFSTREEQLRNIIDNTKITGNDLRDAQAAMLELDEINKQKEQNS